MERTLFKDLYDDILIELVTYFSVEEIIFSFNDIIVNLSSLIKNSHIQSLNEYTSENIFPYIDVSQIISCELNSSEGLKSEQLTYLFCFPHLQSLILHNVLALDNDHSYLLATKHSAVTLDILATDTIKLLHCVFNFIPTLKRFHIQANNIKINLRDIQENLMLNVFSSIEYLKLDLICSWSALPHILMATPYLKVLHAITKPDLAPELPTPLPDTFQLTSLHTLQLTSTDVNLIELGQLVKCMPNLNWCRLYGEAKEEDLLLIESSHWQTFFDKDAIQLKRFTINYLMPNIYTPWLSPYYFSKDRYFSKINFRILFEQRTLLIGDYKR